MSPRVSAAALTVVVVAVLASAGAASAHPLGNVSVNHYAGLVVGTDQVRIDYVLDLAELPTVRERQRIDENGNDTVDAGEQAAYEASRCDELASGLRLTVGERPVTVVAGSAGRLQLLDGAAGLQILRLECEMTAPVGVTSDQTAIAFVDENPRAKVGWSEVTAVGDGVTLGQSDVPDASVSQRLASYPNDVASLDVRTAQLVASPGGAVAPAIGTSPFGDRARAATDRFTALVASDQVTIPLVVTSLVVAMVFGAVHSLAPGHGKSVIAAYLLGQQRDRRLAFLLGATVAVTHTASVLAFGALISVTETAAPERFYPLFGVVSGLLFVALGLALLRQVVRRHRTGRVATPALVIAAPAPSAVLVGAGGVVAPSTEPHPAALEHHDHHGHDHDHHGHEHDGHDHGHEHHGHDHGDGWHEHVHADLGALANGELSWRGVLLPGLAGGLIPSPSALLVFLGGLALGRAWFGVGLVLGYGVGIAATLVTAGWLLARAGDRVGGGALDRWPRLTRLAGYLPAATAVLVIAGGLHIAVRALG